MTVQQTGPNADTVLRGYLQRAEVRLSTMHRIAGAFLGGAGLLLLLPAFLREALVQIWGVINHGAALLAADQGLPMVASQFALSLPVIIAYLIPVSALWLLLQDLTLFYFSANIPKNVTLGAIDEPAFHPRFALTAIPFCDDEASGTKKVLRGIQFGSALKHFVLPHAQRDKKWLKALANTEEGRQVALPDDQWLATCPDDGDRPAMRMAFGLAGAYNRNLTAEVAKAELSLIRHNLNLRRLVLRYMKALLTLVWTTLVSFVVLAWLHDEAPDRQVVAVVGGFLGWAVLAPWIVRAPLRWIYREYDQNAADATSDPHLAKFERWVISGCLLASLVGGFTGSIMFGRVAWLGPVIPALALARSLGWKNDALKWL